MRLLQEGDERGAEELEEELQQRVAVRAAAAAGDEPPEKVQRTDKRTHSTGGNQSRP